MANHNSLTSFHDSDDDDKDSSSLSAKPLSVNNNIINSGLNQELKTPKPENESFFAMLARDAERLNDKSTEEDDDDEEDTPAKATSKKRSKVGRSIRSLFKGRRGTDAAPAAAVISQAPKTEKTPDETPEQTPAELEESPAQESVEQEPAQPDAASEEEPDEQAQAPATPPPILPIVPPVSSQNRAANTVKVPTPTTTPVVPRTPLTASGGGNFVPPAVANTINPVTLNAATANTLNPARANMNTVVENRSGAGPAIAVGMLVHYLSKRRDRKIRKNLELAKREAENTTERLQQTKAQLTQEKQRAQTIEESLSKRISEQVAHNRAVKNRETPAPTLREQEAKTAAEKTEKTPLEHPRPAAEKPKDAPVPVAEVIAAAALARSAEKRAPQAERPIVTPAEAIRPPQKQAEKAKNEEKPAEQPDQRPQKEKLRQEELEQDKKRRAEQLRRAGIERSKDEQTMKEIDLDRHHEVKDEPAIKTQPQFSGQQYKNQPNLNYNTSQNLKSENIPTQINTKSQPSEFNNANTQKNIYKQSMRAGFVVGIAAITIGILAYLLTN